MKKSIILFTVLFMVFSVLTAQVPEWQWVKQAGGSGHDWCGGNSLDANGNSYVVGSFQGTATFGDTTLTSSGPDDIFVAKLDANGNWQWVNQAGGTGNALGIAISTDANGNSYVTGAFTNTATFGSTTLTSGYGTPDIYVAKIDANGNWQWAKKAGDDLYFPDYGVSISVDASGNSYITGFFMGTATFGSTFLPGFGPPTEEIFVAKLDTDGNWQWAKQAGGSSGDGGNGISVDANGNSYITGYFSGTATFGGTTLTSSGGSDIYVAELDPDGNWQWAKQAGGNSGDCGYDTSIDTNGNLYVTGTFESTATFGATTLTSSGGSDIYVAELDTAGNWQWAKQAGGSVSDYSYKIIADANGNSYITGYFNGTATFGTTTLTSSGGRDIFAAELDTDGNWQWAKQAGGSNNEGGGDIDVDANGNVYVSGGFEGTVTFGGITLTNYGTDPSIDDAYLAKLAPLTSITENFDGVTPPALPGDWQCLLEVLPSNTTAEVKTTIHGSAPSAPNTAYINNGLDGSTGQLDPTAFVALVTPLVEVGDNGSILTFWAQGSNPIIVGTMSDPADSATFTLIEEITLTGTFTEYTVALTNPSITYIAFKHGNISTYTPLFVDDVTFEQALPLIGDFNFDGYVDATDLQMFGDHWHFVDTDPGWDPLYDLVPDGIIDAADLQVFGDHWHEGTPPKSSSGKSGKGPNEFAGIVFDLDATTLGNQNLTSIPSQPVGTMIRLDVYCTGVQNLDTYEFEVIYNPTELTYVTSTPTNPITYEGNILESNGGTAVGWMVDTSTPGVLSLAYTLTGTDPAQAPEGEGLIADIVFQALVNTYGTLSFGDVYYYDSYGVVDLITDTGTATLPFELSAFTATYNAVNGYTTIEWTTASENDVIGFNIYRNDCDEFGTAKKINSEIVEGHGSTTEIHEYEFVDIDQLHYGTTYYYWLESVELSGINSVCESISLTPEEGTGGFIDDFEANILTNYPNPFKGSTTIEYGIKGMLKAESVEIKIYNLLGQLVDTVEGKYGTATWNSTNHSTGIYFYKINTESYTDIKKMVITQ